MMHYNSGLGVISKAIGPVTGSSTGTLVTAAATVNTKGAWVSLGTTQVVDAHNIECKLLHPSAAQADFTVDLGIGDGTTGGTYVLAPDLRLMSRYADNPAAVYILPLFAPKNSTVYARCQCSVASATLRVQLTVTSHGYMGAQGYMRMLSLYTPATSRGVAIDPGATTANTKPASWTQMSAGVASRVGAVLAGVGGNGITARAGTTAWLLDLGYGPASSETTFAGNHPLQAESNDDNPSPEVLGPYPVLILPSTRIAARAQCSVITADRMFDLALWGFVP